MKPEDAKSEQPQKKVRVDENKKINIAEMRRRKTSKQNDDTVILDDESPNPFKENESINSVSKARKPNLTINVEKLDMESKDTDMIPVEKEKILTPSRMELLRSKTMSLAEKAQKAAGEIAHKKEDCVIF